MRQLLEDGQVTISRVQGSQTFPSRQYRSFQLGGENAR